MENSIYLGLSRQKTLQTNMTITANNIANMNTPGYRAQNMLFSEYLSDPRGAEDELSFVYDRGQYKTTTSGPVQQTENPLDIALVGSGFFGVQGPGGQVAYSRAGNLQIGLDGSLQTSAGFPVRGAGGGTIVIPDDASEVKIDNKGAVSTQNGQIGQIEIVEFASIQNMKAFGDNMYITEDAAIPATRTAVKQGFLEGSNVNAISEMTSMIDVSRAYQSMQQAMQQENDRLRNAIQKLTRTS